MDDVANKLFNAGKIKRKIASNISRRTSIAVEVDYLTCELCFSYFDFGIKRIQLICWIRQMLHDNRIYYLSIVLFHIKSKYLSADSNFFAHSYLNYLWIVQNIFWLFIFDYPCTNLIFTWIVTFFTHPCIGNSTSHVQLHELV